MILQAGVPMTMSTQVVEASSSSKHRNEAEAHARLELLSNTAMLKKVMDNRVSTWKQQQKVSVEKDLRENSTLGAAMPIKQPSAEDDVSTKQTAGDTVAAVSAATVGPTSKKVFVNITPKPVVEKSSSASPTTMNSPQMNIQQAPNLGAATMATASPTSVNGVGFAPSSYASLLLPAGVHLPPRTGFSHHQFQTNLAMRTALAMMASASASGMYGGPSSAFQKPYVLSKENVPSPASPVAVAASPSLDSCHSHATQSPGETSAREGSQLHHEVPTYETLLQENLRLRDELKQKNKAIEILTTKANGLEKQIFELRQLPTGKISHIPIEDMIRIMQEYGSEVSNQTLPKRKQPIQKASIVRQFRRWNPEFFRYFVHVNGEWVPRLGKEGELKRRVEKRCSFQKNKRSESPDSAKSANN